MKFIIAFLGTMAIIAIVILYFSFSWAYVAQICYSWFILPSFNFPVFLFTQWVGFMMFISVLIHFPAHPSIKEEYLSDDKLSRVIISLISPWLTLIIAWASYKYSPKKLYDQMLLAKHDKKGLWQNPYPEEPYIYRKNHKIN